MQPEKLAEVRSWLKKAASDLRGADIDLAASPPLFEIVKPSGSSDRRRSGISPGWGRSSGELQHLEYGK
jgi:hypothetical protein